MEVEDEVGNAIAADDVELAVRIGGKLALFSLSLFIK